MQRIIAADRVFTGNEWLHSAAVVLNNGRIEQVTQDEELVKAADYFSNSFIAPALIDAQVYGAGKRLFANFPEPETLELMASNFRETGTVLFQPTLATNTIEIFRKGVDAVRQYKNDGGKGVHGLHLEGPWLNAVKRGAHVASLIHAPTVAEVHELLDFGADVISMITVAPEVCSPEIIRLIQSHNIVVSAGHSNATYEQAMQSFDNGIEAVTHLYNAMSPLQHRAPGLVGACFMHQSVRSSIIPDGHHVDYAAIAIAKKMMGNRLFAITDAVAEASEGYYQHQLVGDRYECNGTLSGSAISMLQAMQNLVQHAGISVEEALRMCSLYPAQVLGIDNQYGVVTPGAKADLIVLSDHLQLRHVITA